MSDNKVILKDERTGVVITAVLDVAQRRYIARTSNGLGFRDDMRGSLREWAACCLRMATKDLGDHTYLGFLLI